MEGIQKSNGSDKIVHGSCFMSPVSCDYFKAHLMDPESQIHTSQATLNSTLLP